MCYGYYQAIIQLFSFLYKLILLFQKVMIEAALQLLLMTDIITSLVDVYFQAGNRYIVAKAIVLVLAF